MIGSGTQADPWVPLNAAELKDCWSNRGGYIDLTCDIDMGELAFGDPRISPKVTLSLNGFSLYVRKTASIYIFSSNDYSSTISNGLVFFVPSNDVGVAYINYGDAGSVVSNIILINYGNSYVEVARTSIQERYKIVCINIKANKDTQGKFSCLYQNVLYSGMFFKIGCALPSDIDAAGLPKDVFYIDDYLGGKNLRIEKKGKSFVSGVTQDNGNPVKMELTIVGVKSSAKWSGYSGTDGVFTINLGSYSDPVSVFAYDIINKKLRSNNAYLVGDVAITSPDEGVKFTCVTAGVTTELPNPLPSTGTITLGTAVFEVKKISPSSCAGPMIPASKYSNYAIKSK